MNNNDSLSDTALFSMTLADAMILAQLAQADAAMPTSEDTLRDLINAQRVIFGQGWTQDNYAQFKVLTMALIKKENTERTKLWTKRKELAEEIRRQMAHVAAGYHLTGLAAYKDLYRRLERNLNVMGFDY